MEQISKPASRVLEELTRKKVGRTMEVLEISGATDLLKSSIKKQFWDLKDEIENIILNGDVTDGEYSE